MYQIFSKSLAKPRFQNSCLLQYAHSTLLSVALVLIGVFSRYVERYDPAKNEWSFVSSMNDTRDGACVVADDNNIFAITGFAGQSYLSTIDVYDPSKNVWTTQGMHTQGGKINFSVKIYEQISFLKI